MRVRCLLLISFFLLFVACPGKTSRAPGGRKTAAQTTTVPADAGNARVNVEVPVHEISVLERSALGSKIDKDGNVTDSKDTFKAGEPLYVTMWLKQSPGGLQTSVRFLDAHEKEIAWPKTNMKGEKVVTQRLDTSKLAPGAYHAICYWGMDEERDYQFTIEGKKK